MGSIRERGKFQFQARIIRKGWPVQTKTFNDKPAAQAWIRLIESEMDRGIFVSRTEAESTTLRDALDRYLVEVTPTKKGQAQETSSARHALILAIRTSFVGSIWLARGFSSCC